MKTCIVSTLAFAAAATAGAAQEIEIGPDRYAITLRHVDIHLTTPDAARRTLARIDDAALAVCGASGFSLSEVKRAVHASACWRESMTDAVKQIDYPPLSQLWRKNQSRRSLR